MICSDSLYRFIRIFKYNDNNNCLFVLKTGPMRVIDITMIVETNELTNKTIKSFVLIINPTVIQKNLSVMIFFSDDHQSVPDWQQQVINPFVTADHFVEVLYVESIFIIIVFRSVNLFIPQNIVG